MLRVAGTSRDAPATFFIFATGRRADLVGRRQADCCALQLPGKSKKTLPKASAYLHLTYDGVEMPHKGRLEMQAMQW
jgi:hypothetical protein